MTSQEAILTVIDALEAAAIPYMFIGSFSSNFYGIPRSSHDVDIVVQPANVAVAALMDHLGPGFSLNPPLAADTRVGAIPIAFQCVDTQLLVELFPLRDRAFDRERFARRCRVRVLDRDTYVPTAEDVLISKVGGSLKEERRRDLDDARNILAVQGDRFDWDYVHRWCDLLDIRERLEEIRRSVPPALRH